MEALLLSAGLGTRLRPLTDVKPKALVEVNGQTLLERNIKQLRDNGVTHIIINIHHLGEQITDYLEGREWGIEISISDERARLLDTGGGIRHALPLMKEDGAILIHNVDILSDIDLQAMMVRHRQQHNIATLAASERESSRRLFFYNEKLAGWRNDKTGEEIWTNVCRAYDKAMAFSGISLIERRMIELLPENGTPYPIIPEYLRISKTEKIGYYEHDAERWIDVGTPQAIAKARQKSFIR